MKFNEKDVITFYNFFKHNNPTEIRVFDAEKYPEGKSVFVNDEKEFVDKCRYYSEEEEVSVYIGARDRKARGDKNVISSHFIFFEIDEHGENKDSEKDKILNFLKDNNVEVSMIGMSGGGWHFYIPHRLQKFASEEEALSYKKNSLGSFKNVLIDKGFDVDGAVFNLERVTRVLGTYNKKRSKISFIELINNDIDLVKNSEALIKIVEGYVPKQKNVIINFDPDDDDFIKELKSKWVEGDRQDLTISLAGYLRKEKGFGLPHTLQLIEKICSDCGDTDWNERKAGIEKTYEKDEADIKGAMGLIEKGVEIKDIKNTIKNLIFKKNEDEATEYITDYILKGHFIYTTRDDIKSEIWYYNDGIYIPNGKSLIKEKTRELLEDAYTPQRVNKVIAKVEADTQIEHDVFFTNNDIKEIPIRNGILNIFTREIKPFTHKKIFFNKLPIFYNKDAKCENIIKFFSDVLKDESDINVMFELIGFCLMKEYKFEKAFMFIGNGRNGKGKTLSLIKRFLGIQNCSSIPLAQINSGSTSVCELHGRLANIAGDLSNTDLKETGMFKQITGRDLITAKRKYLRDLFFENYAKVVFACNELPKVYDLSDGFWSRWVLFEFPYKFVKIEEFSKQPFHKIMDEDIINKISNDNELSGLLNMALDGLKRLLKNHGFSYSKGTEEVKDLWIRKSDSFTAFCIDNIKEDANSKIPKKNIRKAFSNYCRKHKIMGASDKAIKVTLENRYGAYEFREWEGSREIYWEGIRFI